METTKDIEHHRRRAAAERALAAKQPDPTIAALHIQMAVHHETYLYGEAEFDADLNDNATGNAAPEATVSYSPAGFKARRSRSILHLR